MVDSSNVLWGQTVVYTLYALVIISLIGWFAHNLTRGEGSSAVKPGVFYGFVGFLVVVGVSLHIVTYNTIPWSPVDVHRSQIQPDQVFNIVMQNHEFDLPSSRLQINCDAIVAFEVTSKDLTYGFGLFRPDNSMAFQMQVVPGHQNELLWQFGEDGLYTVRSTEYSGPEGYQMVVPDAVEVTGCPQ